MVRRRSRSSPDLAIPQGWSTHDGMGMPVHRESRPAVLFRSGVKLKMGAYPARHWADMARDCWRWADPPSGLDIIAWRDEPDEWIAVPRLN